MTTWVAELSDLEDITESFNYENTKSEAFPMHTYTDLSNVDREDIYNTISLFIEEYITSNLDSYKYPNFYDKLKEYLLGIFDIAFDDFTSKFDISVSECIDDVCNLYFILNKNHRSYPSSIILENYTNNRNIKKRIRELFAIELPPQRSQGWYEYRYNKLTASNFWEALDTQSSKNRLIVSKCKPLTIKKSVVNTQSACHKGHRYEPVSIMIYELVNSTTVGELGCVPHKKHSFLAASPDGINIDPASPIYGRLLEIKNPKSRELTGIPIKKYWIQMQLQMEVLDLPECDFYETCFEEYENEEAFLNDGESFNRTKDGKRKGIIVQFSGNDEVYYEYPKIEGTKKEFEKWYTKCMEEKDESLTWDKNIYWYLKDESCVLVPRNKEWFESIVPTVSDLWKQIEHDRIHGYEHRKPKPKTRAKKSIGMEINTTKFQPMGCFTLNSDSDSEDNNTTDDTKVNTKINKKINTKVNTNASNSNTVVYKVRTESFDSVRSV